MSKTIFYMTAAAMALSLGACGAPENAQPASASVKSAATPETLSVKTDVIADGLSAPWGLAFLPSGDYLVTEKTGGVIRIDASGVKTPVSGGPKAYVAGQGGLHDIALSPNFNTDNTVYITYAYGDAAANGTAVFKGVLSGDTLTGETIFESHPPKDTPNHYGARMAFLPDGNFLLTVGEGYAYREKAQDLSSHLGKLLRLTPDGKAAAGNPFTGQEGKRAEIYSYGHRNSQGLLYDAASDTVWLHEHGPKGGDEINRIEAAKNYGWPVATFGIDYSGAQISPYQTYEGMTDSLYYWKPSIAPSGFALIRGDMFADWSGDLLVGGLASKDLRRVHMDSGKPVSETILLGDMSARIRDVRLGPDGAIYVLTDAPDDGKLIRITPH
ncbi:PQQ-dependent sugar dehydrogenase [Robiginitomaculum antarcticum]|uniref:PQQ-dependent sugar dehydrogenase n=1 Tax=Robiginitomaculum antarcticum TaxID=437507 RepID=UPI00036D9187|nr:PQQ-dependent sugar dehydrogenase [Robiginitomaculum antarcticum]